MRSPNRLLATLAALGALLLPARAAIDTSPADGLPDIWAIVKGGGVSPVGDEDGDGQTNAAEAAAGTNPKNASDVIRIKSFTRSGANVTLVFPAVGRKKYEVQSSASPGSAGFAALAPPSIQTPTRGMGASPTTAGCKRCQTP